MDDGWKYMVIGDYVDLTVGLCSGCKCAAVVG